MQEKDLEIPRRSCRDTGIRQRLLIIFIQTNYVSQAHRYVDWMNGCYKTYGYVAIGRGFLFSMKFTLRLA